MYKRTCFRRKTVSSRCLKPFMKQRSDEEKRSENCCSRLLNKQFITGSVEIAKSKRSHRRVVKLFVFLICTIGFFYQTWAYLQVYLTYPTEQKINEEYPEEMMAPALTICNNNRLFRQRLCTIFPGDCEGANSTWEEFCDAHRRQCVDGPMSEINTAFPYRFGGYKENRSNIILNTLGPNKESDFLWTYSQYLINTEYSEQSSRIIQVAKNGYPYNCFLLFSLLGKENEEPLTASYKDRYEISLYMYPEQYIEENDLVQAWVIFHDPRKVANPMTEGVPLPTGKNYDLFLTMERTIRLPPPYASQCTDYLKEWKKNGGYGPLSKRDCIDQCKIDAMVEENGCVGHEITYPNNYSICDYSAPASAEIVVKCASICRDACEENVYHVTQESRKVDQCSPKHEYCQSRYLELGVKFTRMMVQTSQLVPRTESIEFFSNIGAFLGIWLGISLASTFDFIKMIHDIVYPWLKGKRNQKKAAPTEKFRH